MSNSTRMPHSASFELSAEDNCLAE
jgi:hypothetical protein